MTNPTAIVVEDNETLVNVFSTALEAAGYEVQFVRTGDDAWRLLQVETPHVLVLDLHLPGISGQELLERVQANGRFAHTRIIITSADAELAEYLQDRVDLVLEKPVSFHQLRQLSERLKPPSDPN